MSFKAKNRLKVYSPDKIKSILERKLKSPTGYYNVALFKREDVDISVPTYGVEDTIRMVKGFLNGRWVHYALKYLSSTVWLTYGILTINW